jgi:NADH:ubiquinone oxidoreductase subunit H
MPQSPRTGLYNRTYRAHRGSLFQEGRFSFLGRCRVWLCWFLFKVSTIIYLLIWFRGTFPRFRYDQLMNIGWKIAIPVGMAAVLINAVLGMTRHG